RLEGPQLERGAGQLGEVLLQPRGAAVEPAAGRGVGEGDVVEAGAGAEAECHLLAERDAVEAEQVAQRRRAAVLARDVGVAGDEGHERDYPAPRWITRTSECCARCAPAGTPPPPSGRRGRSERPATTAPSGSPSASCWRSSTAATAKRG